MSTEWWKAGENHSHWYRASKWVHPSHTSGSNRIGNPNQCCYPHPSGTFGFRQNRLRHCYPVYMSGIQNHKSRGRSPEHSLEYRNMSRRAASRAPLFCSKFRTQRGDAFPLNHEESSATRAGFASKSSSKPLHNSQYSGRNREKNLKIRRAAH